MARSFLRRWVVVAAALSVVATASAGAATSPKGPSGRAARTPHLAATGNAAAIAFYRKVAAATDKMDSERFTYSAAQTLVRVKNLGGGRLSWIMAGAPKAGYQPAYGTVWAEALDGRTTYAAETVLPVNAASGFNPFELVLTPKGEVMMTLGSSGPVSCGGTVTGKPYVGLFTVTGYPLGYTVEGRFSPLRRVGDTVYVTSTYHWGPQKLIEVDTISAATYLPSRSVYRVFPYHTIPGFTFVQYDLTWGTTPVAPPVSSGVCATYLASIK